MVTHLASPSTTGAQLGAGEARGRLGGGVSDTSDTLSVLGGTRARTPYMEIRVRRVRNGGNPRFLGHSVSQSGLPRPRSECTQAAAPGGRERWPVHGSRRQSRDRRGETRTFRPGIGSTTGRAAHCERFSHARAHLLASWSGSRSLSSVAGSAMQSAGLVEGGVAMKGEVASAGPARERIIAPLARRWGKPIGAPSAPLGLPFGRRHQWRT